MVELAEKPSGMVGVEEMEGMPLQQGEGVGMEVMELESKVSPATAGTPLAELEVPAEMAGRDILASLVRVVV
jgi:hypothetical protein